MTKQLSSETVDTVDNGTKTSVENVVENAAKSKVETGTNKHERNRRRSSDFDEEDWQEKGKVIDEVKICSYENNYKEVYFAKQTDTSISTVRRIFSFRTQKTAASWSSIFKLVKCLSNECVNANHLVVLLGTMLLYLVGNAAKVHFYLEGNRKFFIEIKFKKDVTVFKRERRNPWATMNAEILMMSSNKISTVRTWYNLLPGKRLFLPVYSFANPYIVK